MKHGVTHLTPFAWIVHWLCMPICIIVDQTSTICQVSAIIMNGLCWHFYAEFTQQETKYNSPRSFRKSCVRSWPYLTCLDMSDSLLTCVCRLGNSSLDLPLTCLYRLSHNSLDWFLTCLIYLPTTCLSC